MPFTEAQKKAIDLRGANILVSASAGSGKTSVLVERLCQLVTHDKISINHILAMTFTNDAASEMKERLRQELLKQEQTSYIRDQLALLETAQICTIDSFCLSLVQNYYYQIPISLKMANAIASDAQKQQAFDQAFQHAKESLSLPHLNDYIWAMHIKDNDLQKALKDTIAIAWAKPDPLQWLQDVRKNRFDSDIDAWFMKYFRQHIQAIIEICDLAQDMDDRFGEKKVALEALLPLDYDNMRSHFLVYFAKYGYFRFAKKTTHSSKDEFNPYKDALAFHEKAIAQYLFDSYDDTTAILSEFCDLVQTTQQEYAKIKQEMEIIDFSDMETFAHQLLKNPLIQEEVSKQYDMILVDEFQDTNDLQESIIHLIERGDNVFRVGDVKQSIYGFRQARPEIMKNHMKSDEDTLIVMDKNFRSNANIIAFNNDFYEKIMNGPLCGTQFEKVDIAYPGATYQTENPQYPIRFLYSTEKEENRFDIIAHDILKQHEKGRSYRDICILTRDNKPQENIKNVLEAYDIPVYTDLKSGFYQVAAIQIVLTTLSSIYDPMDDISLTASLLSPIGRVSCEQLAKCCSDKEKNESLFMHIKEQDCMHDWLSLYEQSHDSPTEWLQAIYQFHDFYMKHTTSLEKTNLDALLEKSCEFDTLSDFIEALQKDSKADSVGPASAFSKQDDVVQIKTMHASKGLQFPVVYILSNHGSNKHKSNAFMMDADLGISCFSEDGQIKKPTKSYVAMKTKHAQEALQEEMRVFYVATTRAQQELIFVDQIKDTKSYTGPLTSSVLLQDQSYTGWLFHTYFEDPSAPVHFIQCNLLERPESKDPISNPRSWKTYEKPSTWIQSSTASQAKRILAWQPLELVKKQNTTRGTLFHEIMQCPFPYQIQDMEQMAKKYGYVLSSTDIKQLQTMNTNPLYQQWMQEKHEFECSYIVKDHNQITNGFMDLVVWEENQIIIVDYKTDTATAEELIETYHKQLETYKKAMEIMEPSKPIQTYIYSFHLGQIITI